MTRIRPLGAGVAELVDAADSKFPKRVSSRTNMFHYPLFFRDNQTYGFSEFHPVSRSN